MKKKCLKIKFYIMILIYDRLAVVWMSEQASSLCHIRLEPHWDVISSFYIKHFVLHLETSIKCA